MVPRTRRPLQDDTETLVRHLNDLLTRFRPVGSSLTPANRLIISAFDDLLAHLDEVYGSNPVSPDEVRDALLCGPLSPEDMLRYPRGIVPILIVRDLLRNHGLCIKTSSSPSFAAFLRRHAAALNAA